jgi:hypothetical protein
VPPGLGLQATRVHEGLFQGPGEGVGGLVLGQRVPNNPSAIAEWQAVASAYNNFTVTPW